MNDVIDNEELDKISEMFNNKYKKAKKNSKKINEVKELIDEIIDSNKTYFDPSDIDEARLIAISEIHDISIKNIIKSIDINSEKLDKKLKILNF